MKEHTPAPLGAAAVALIRCIARTGVLLARRRVHLPKEHVGIRLRFADGTSGRVYRETVIANGSPENPCLLLVKFQLRGIRGWGHTVFRWESLLNTPLFVGFPGFVSKLWLAHDEHGVYRGVYEWDGAAAADHYARSLWRVLALVCIPESIDYIVLPGMRRDDLLLDSREVHTGPPALATTWWRLVDAA